jgi:endo-1,4-beta-xylanase
VSKPKKKPLNRAHKSWWVYTILLICIISGLYLALSRADKTPNLPNPPLKVLAAKHNIELGNFAMSSRIDEKPYREILTGQFNVALLDNTPNWYFTDGGLRPSATAYNFSQMDQLVNFAQENHMSMQAHHFVWGEDKWLPQWLKSGHYSREQLFDLLHQHIATVGGRYRDKIAEWTVVNEPFTREQHIFGLNDWWADHTGDNSYISQSYIWARQADPSAKLILNDFNNETQNSVSDDMYNYIKQAKASGVPIDGIGMQMHLDGAHPPDKQAVIDNMRRFGALGVGVYVTEFDVNMSNVKASDKEKDQKEADIYYQMMRACIESQVCHSFSILGITDKETWYNYMPSSADARPLPFDKHYNPKPAYWALRRALEEK